MQNQVQTYAFPLKQKLEEGKFTVCSVGAGYVGSLTSIILAAQQPNLKVIVCDVNQDLINSWSDQRYPFYEPELDRQFDIAVNQNKNIKFTTKITDAIQESDAIFICVNTPPKKDLISGLGKESDMKYFDLACQTIASMGDPKKHRILIEKSTFQIQLNILGTVPVGTHKRIHGILSQKLSNPDDCYTIVSMPEFLAEGVAIQNLLFPDRIVVGTPTDKNGMETFEVIKGIYSNFQTKFIHVKTASSELGKLFANAMLAQRISSINSMSQLCETTGASVQDLSKIVGSDKRIGQYFLNASPAFGGSCFEKDLQSLVYILESLGQTDQAMYWSQVLHMNQFQKRRLLDMIISEFPNPSETVLTIFGFAFKKNTSDTRMTPIAYFVNGLIEKGFFVRIHDPQANERGFYLEMEMQGFDIAERFNFQFCGSDYNKAVANSNAIIIGTEWDEYITTNYRNIRDQMNQSRALFFDLRSIVDEEPLKYLGFEKVFKLGN
ncbi:uridine diphosphate glucose dehydrogenase [Stylonychia lemnae]|uniref:UDP-glucose 6-dehydrogenase n=1 Tax=Stylonychia lemnae TaxID=5949 RepID=A0A078AKV7_STYLE|nr:uridine diphosphate glucose dehydrogenase [Stylonychia lemnae]|eukprot:CDW82077.1 uridine diphosphate glucose dehydrogenase [Stylonychia lemnae]